MSVTEGTFTLAPGQAATSPSRSAACPPAASLYGALEVVGLPADIAKRKGVITGYRLVGPLRYKPARQAYALKAGTREGQQGQRRAAGPQHRQHQREPVSASATFKSADRHAPARSAQGVRDPAGQDS